MWHWSVWWTKSCPSAFGLDVSTGRGLCCLKPPENPSFSKDWDFLVLKYRGIPSAVTSTYYEDLWKNYDCQDVFPKSERLNYSLRKGGFLWIDSKDSDRRRLFTQTSSWYGCQSGPSNDSCKLSRDRCRPSKSLKSWTVHLMHVRHSCTGASIQYVQQEIFKHCNQKYLQQLAIFGMKEISTEDLCMKIPSFLLPSLGDDVSKGCWPSELARISVDLGRFAVGEQQSCLWDGDLKICVADKFTVKNQNPIEQIAFFGMWMGTIQKLYGLVSPWMGSLFQPKSIRFRPKNHQEFGASPKKCAPSDTETTSAQPSSRVLEGNIDTILENSPRNFGVSNFKIYSL